MYNSRDVGTCSNCGGIVSVHEGNWLGLVPPKPTCNSCGATPKLPVMQMGPPTRTVTTKTAIDKFKLMPKTIHTPDGEYDVEKNEWRANPNVNQQLKAFTDMTVARQREVMPILQIGDVISYTICVGDLDKAGRAKVLTSPKIITGLVYSVEVMRGASKIRVISTEVYKLWRNRKLIWEKK